jgi:hypothetical protein
VTGTATRFYTGDFEADLARACWYEGNARETVHPVGKKEPNAWAHRLRTSDRLAAWEFGLRSTREQVSPLDSITSRVRDHVVAYALPTQTQPNPLIEI